MAGSPAGHNRSHSSRKLLAPAASCTSSFATGAVTVVPVRQVLCLDSGGMMVVADQKRGHGTPILFVKKKDGSLHFCVNFHSLNCITKKDHYPLLLISVLLDAPSKAHIFMEMNVGHTYHLIQIAEGDEANNTFQTHYGSFEWLVSPSDSPMPHPPSNTS